MAFTGAELVRGAVSAWVMFMTTLLLSTTITAAAYSSFPGWGSPGTLLPSVLIVDAAVLIIGGIVSALVTVLGTLLAHMLGSLLRHEASLRVHVAIFTAFGVGVGKTYILVLLLMQIPQSVGVFGAPLAFPAVLVALAVPLGWWYTAWRALLEDSRTRSQAARVQSIQDAVAEVRP
ncbi:hypothetical protein [Microbacterium sp. OVT16B]|nr:hypothetical protein [Microbacterium sp. OVT16B]PRB11484.1 hypothetical protein CQ047_04420 [Microbacterium sp. MYb72]